MQNDSRLVPPLWHSAVLGALSSGAYSELGGLGLEQFDMIMTDTSAVAVVKHVITRIAADRTTQLIVDPPIPEDSCHPIDLSLLNVGLYRSLRAQSWTEPSVAVAGNTIDDFLLYYNVSRMHPRVVWVLPSIVDRALGRIDEPSSSVELYFATEVLSAARYSNRTTGGLAYLTYSLTPGQLTAVADEVSKRGISSLPTTNIIGTGSLNELFDHPIVANEINNFEQDMLIQVQNGAMVGRFKTPKPKNFTKLHPHEHRGVPSLPS